MAVDIALSIATPFLEYLIKPVGRQFGYLLFYKRYLKELEESVRKLKGERESIQHRCEAEERNAMVIEEKVKTWFDDVNTAVKDADILIVHDDDVQSWNICFCLNPPVIRSQEDTILQDVDRHARKRFCYLNPVICYKKGRKAKKTKETVDQLNQEGKNLGDISHEAPIHPELSAKEFKAFASRSKIVEDIMEALSDASISVIGVWGMGGVGKSTLLKEVMRVAKEKNLFDDVAIATVSQNPEVKRIQGEIAFWLDLKLENGDQTVRRRAARLHKRLKNNNDKQSTAEPLEIKKQDSVVLLHEEKQDKNLFGRTFWTKSADHEKQDDQIPLEEEKDKKSAIVLESGKKNQVLIILDDLWRGLDLEEVGIPQDAGAVKLLLTSRNHHLLSSEMGCIGRNVFKLEVLKDDEPWRLFESIVVGEKEGLVDDKLRSIGEELVNKCSGLPLVLKATAMALKNCSLPEWEDALAQVRGSKDAYSNLEISYRHLESNELKSLFLVCALIGTAQISVQDVFYYSLGLGLLRGGTNTVRNARDKMKALLHSLQASSLLFEDQDRDYVKLHDVVREVAIRIASRDQYSFLISDEFELKEIPQEKLKNSRAISIPYANIQKLTERWECPELKMFLLFGKDDPPIEVSDSFFKGMRELKVLDFTEWRSDSLPSSIQLLENLNTLCVDWSSLKDLTIIGKLKQLQILTFRGSEIARLPKEIGELSELKVLDLENSKIETIEPQVFGKLTSLEELNMKGCSFMGWEVEREIQPRNAKVSELNNMLNLSSVKIRMGDFTRIPKQLKFGNLFEYIIQIGDVGDWSGDYKESRTLKINLKLCRGNFLREKWVQDLLKRTQDLHLVGLNGRKKSINELCLQDGFQELKHLNVQNSSSVQFVARSLSTWLPCTAFTVLESLFLENLPELEMISRGPAVADSFSKLKVIKVTNCGKINNLFCYSMMESLSHLEEIEVKDCEAMQEIITVDSVATNYEAIETRLQVIKLNNLPNFMRFCSSQNEANHTEMPSSSEIMSEDHCIRTNTLFFNELVLLTRLKSVILSGLPKLKNIWHNNCPVEVANLEYLKVRSCKDLLSVIPSCLVTKLGNLETLIVRDCGSVQQVFESSDGDTLNGNMEVLPQLNKLKLYDLPCLRHIWLENFHHQLKKVIRVFQKLNILKVVNCSSLMNLLPAAVMKTLNQITNIYIENCEKMEAVVPAESSDGGERVMTNIVFCLVDIWLENLPNMVAFVRANRHQSINFPSLKGVWVKNCPKMRALSLPETEEGANLDCDESLPLFFFDRKVLLPNLVRLYFVSMGSIEKIWHEEIPEELEILVIKDCQNLVDIFPSHIIGTGGFPFQNLEHIYIRECTSFEGPLFKLAGEEKGKGYKKGYQSLPQLEKLWLFDLPKLEHVVQPTSHVVLGFPNLVDITIRDCKSVIDVLPIATAPTLSKLEELEILRCSSMRQVFGKQEDEEEDEMMDSILFPCLRSIVIENLDSLICFFLGSSCVLDFPSLETLDISWCSNMKTFIQRRLRSDQLEELAPFTNEGIHYLFNDKVLLPNLVRLYLVSMGSIEKIWHEEIPEESFCQLKLLFIKDCQNLVDIFPFQNLETISIIGTGGFPFQNLEHIDISECTSFEGPLFKLAGEEKGKGYKKGYQSLPQLEKLWLFNLPKLEHVVQPTSHVALGFPNLVDITIRDCKSVIDVLPIATAPTLSKLEELEILRCCSMRQVFGKQEDEEEDEMMDSILFPCLRSIVIENLDSLICFFLGSSCVLDFPSLELLHIARCLNMKTFNQRRLTSVQLEELAPSTNEGIHYLFDDKVQFPNLQKMKLFQLSSLQTIWRSRELLVPTSCRFDSFCRLKSLIVSDCKYLQHIFPASLASNLVQLEELDVNSSGVEEIVMHDIDDGSRELDASKPSQLLFFPQLSSLTLGDLPNLRSFFRGSYASTWPALKKLWMWHCDKAQTFTSNCESSCSRQSLFSAEQVIPMLEKLRLVEEDVIRIQKGEFTDDIFTRLKVFCLSCFHDERAAFPSQFLLDKFQKLERLNVFCSSFEEIFPDESLSPQEVISYKQRFAFAGEGNERPFASLREIKLSVLHNLKHVWKADMTIFSEILKSVQVLEVYSCKSLTSLFPCPTATASFVNITTVEVHNCGGLLELMTTSAATSLAKLTSMDIYECGEIREIVSAGEYDGSTKSAKDGEELVICFRELKHLGFHRLRSLASFSSTTYTFEFPSLEEVIVLECPSMNIFSKGIVVAPRLIEVQLTKKKDEKKVRWDGDLNSTIQNLFEKNRGEGG